MLVAIICGLAASAVMLVQGGTRALNTAAESSSASPSAPLHEPAPSSSEALSLSSRPEPESEVPSSKEPESSLVPSSDLPESSMPNQPQDSAAVDFSGSVLIGDSRTEAFQEYGVITNAAFLAHQGLMVNSLFTRPVIGAGSNKATVMDALKQGTYNHVYLMLGLNELGWSYVPAFEEKYTEVLETIRTIQPGATIYAEAVFPVSAKKSATDKVFNNERIAQYNEIIERVAKKQGAIFIPVSKELMDGSGALPAEASADGIHPEADFCRKWARYIRSFAN